LLRHYAEHGALPLRGASGMALAFLLAHLQRDTQRPIVAIVETPAAAVALKRDLRYWSERLGQPQDVLRFVPTDATPWDQVIPDRRTAMRRLHTLFRLAHPAASPWGFCVLSADTLLLRQQPKERLVAHCLSVGVGDVLPRAQFSSWLHRSGYRQAPLVEEPGNCAVRGFVVDVFVPGFAHPFRIAFFDDTVESIRVFGVDTQETVAHLDAVTLHPARQMVLPEEVAGHTHIADRLREICDAVNVPTGRSKALIDDVLNGLSVAGVHGFLPAFEPHLVPLHHYFPEDAIVVAEDPEAIFLAMARANDQLRLAHARSVDAGHPAFSFSDLVAEADGVAEELRQRMGVYTSPLAAGDALDMNAREVMTLGGQTLRALSQAEGRDILDILTRLLDAMVEDGYRVIIVSHTQGQSERLAALFHSRQMDAKPLTGHDLRMRPGLYLDVGELARGGILPGEGLCVLSEADIFGQRARTARRHGPKGAGALDLRMLTPGDLVVHAEHGIGKYLGLVRQNIHGAEMDFLLLAYRNNDKLYLPVYRLSAIQKYQSASETHPPLDRLGGQTFSVSRTAARKRAMEIAAQLLDIYARRNLSKRPPLAPADDMFRAFEAAFPFEETPDQQQVIDEVLADLEAERPMDRLVCGDVGFGKTEVAMRAAFRVVMSGLQVAVLVPTTVLAQQHYESFRKRFAAWPLHIRMLSRFRTPAQNTETVGALKSGTCDIVIGTHRLLSADVHFKQLGLLVVDEEHRFGVAHKERIRALKASVDTLAMTATPIPRTLNMALLRLRDLSCISTPPLNRRPIRTVICHDDDAVIRQAIERELGRDGQVFFVHNRVRGIQRVADRVRKLVPAARVAVGHGQMNETALEQVMRDFMEGRVDVLVSSAIIESGLDIPRANTILIDRADTLGLAQLYQMRGRVGRTDTQAFAFLIVPPLEMLSDDARRRVEALTRYTELGSGFALASLDLEIRGAGNLLGAEQSGEASLVGFEMFMELIDEAAQVLQGRVPEPPVEPELTLDQPGYIDAAYIPEVGQRLQYYKRLSLALDEPEVRAIAAELIDRFGPLPDEAEQFIEGMTARALCRELVIVGLDANAQRVVCHLDERTRLCPERLLKLVEDAPSQLRFTSDFRLSQTFLPGEPAGASGAIRFLQHLKMRALR
jgi:transcription-repair coupling factor (superfamily II helicase)